MKSEINYAIEKTDNKQIELKLKKKDFSESFFEIIFFINFERKMKGS